MCEMWPMFLLVMSTIAILFVLLRKFPSDISKARNQYIMHMIQVKMLYYYRGIIHHGGDKK